MSLGRELSTGRYESSEILPSALPARHLKGAGLNSLRSLSALWITHTGMGRVLFG